MASPILRYRMKKLATALLDDDYGISAEAVQALYELVKAIDEDLLNEIRKPIRATNDRFYFKEQ